MRGMPAVPALLARGSYNGVLSMSVFPFFSSCRQPRKPKTTPRKAHVPLRVEALEDRSLPSGITISGFVYNDVNNNGLFDSGETAIANNPIELHNASGAVVASA